MERKEVDLMTLAELIRVYRTQRRMSLSGVADIAGCARAHVHAMEQGRSCNPNVSTIHGLAVALGLPFPVVAECALKGARMAAVRP